MLTESGRLRAFVPPFQFTSFFSPEDTLLGMIAAEAALAHARLPGAYRMPGANQLRIAELTSGSGLIGLHLLRIERNSSLIGLDIDPSASGVASANAERLGLSRRARFVRADMWSNNTQSLLRRERPQLLVCNPPYIPEPLDGKIAEEAGAGPDGTAHLMRALALAKAIRPRAMALSWCSLSDPERVVLEAERNGYVLNSLFITVIADGEYSGSVEGYVRTLPRAFLNSARETLLAVAPDGSASFAFLLISGDFSRSEQGPKRKDNKASEQVRIICSRFARRGIAAVAALEASFPVRVWLLDRWDETRLRAFLHGSIQRASLEPE